MKSSIQTLRSVISGLKSKKNINKEIILITAINTIENTFSVGSGRKKEKFTKVPHFASATGQLCPAAAGGYQMSKNDSYKAEIVVDSGVATRMFNVIYDSKNNPIIVLNASYKSVAFSKVAPDTTKPPLTRERRGVIVKAIKELSQTVEGGKLTRVFSVEGNGIPRNVAEGSYVSENLTEILKERNLKIHEKFNKNIFSLFRGTIQ